jgi:hypothetical protein
MSNMNRIEVETSPPLIYILHENKEWFAPLGAQLEQQGLPFEEWYMHETRFDPGEEPPQGIFYSRMSASSHTRGHRYAPEYAAAVLAWLEHHGRRVLNGSRALQLELSKAVQYSALHASGIRTPRTYAALGTKQILAAADNFGGDAFIVKHNRAGKGLGVHLFMAKRGLLDYVQGPDFEQSVDGITLVQEYIESAEPFITRCEFVGQRFMYALRVDNTQGFLLCPADECDSGESFCPAGDGRGAKFRIDPDFNDGIIESYQSFFERNDIHIAGIEFIVDKNGDPYTYDININTNYNSSAEKAAGESGMREIAKYLRSELSTYCAKPGYLTRRLCSTIDPNRRAE